MTHMNMQLTFDTIHDSQLLDHIHSLPTTKHIHDYILNATRIGHKCIQMTSIQNAQHDSHQQIEFIKTQLQDVFQNRLTQEQQKQSAIKSELEQQYHNKLQVIQMQADLDKQRAILQHQQNIDTSGYPALHEKISLLTNALEEAKQENKKLYQDMIASVQTNQVNHLVKVIAEKDLLIAQLKGTNFCKGIIGEQIVKHILTNKFIDHDVIDKSSSPAESDLHLVRPDGSFFAIECKYKATITNSDVEKSIRDISVLKQKYSTSFLGYVFLSLQTPNIPKKGFGFEIQQGIPVMWYGVQNNQLDHRLEEDLSLIIRIMSTLTQLIKTSPSQDNTLFKCIELVRSLSITISNNKMTISKLNESVLNMQLHINNLHKTNNDIYQSIHTFILEHNIPIPHIPSENPTQYKCNKCSKIFKRKSDYTKHVQRVCGVVDDDAL
jgi:hypothetical protein